MLTWFVPRRDATVLSLYLTRHSGRRHQRPNPSPISSSVLHHQAYLPLVIPLVTPESPQFLFFNTIVKSNITSHHQPCLLQGPVSGSRP